MTINGVDVWTAYSAFLCEDRADDSTNVAALTKLADMKEYTSVNFRERDGEDLPATLTPRAKPRDVTLYIAIYGASCAEYDNHLDALMEALRAGWLDINVLGLSKTYRMYFQGSGDPKVVTDVYTGETVGLCKIKFREPKPSITENV
jgi:hypothetical protein